MSLLPSRPEAEPPEDAGPRVIGLESEDADDVLAALSSETARSLLAAIHEDPAPPSELADRVDTSLQNAQYHLEKLENAGAVEVVDTAYSAKGREMDVYAPADQPLVIFAGDEERGSTLRTALSRLLGSLGVLAFASLVVQAVFGAGGLPDIGSGSPSGGGADGSAGDGDGAGGDGGGAGGDGAAPVGDDGGGTVTSTETVEVTGGTATPEPATPQATGTPQATETPLATPEPTGTPVPEPTGTPTETPTETAREFVTETATETARAVSEGAGGLEPGLVFFAGGLFAIAVVTVVLFVRRG